jgi:hypothetical protein
MRKAADHVDHRAGAYWRGRARRALVQAELTTDPQVQAMLKEIAEDYWALAEKAEASRSDREQDDD